MISKKKKYQLITLVLQQEREEDKHTCTLAPVTMLGLSHGLPSDLLLACHFLLKASPANIMASDEPTVPTPMAVSSTCTGAWKRWAIILTQRFCTKYWVTVESISTKLFTIKSWIPLKYIGHSASNEIKVSVTYILCEFCSRLCDNYHLMSNLKYYVEWNILSN